MRHGSGYKQSLWRINSNGKRWEVNRAISLAFLYDRWTTVRGCRFKFLLLADDGLTRITMSELLSTLHDIARPKKFRARPTYEQLEPEWSAFEHRFSLGERISQKSQQLHSWCWRFKSHCWRAVSPAMDFWQASQFEIVTAKVSTSGRPNYPRDYNVQIKPQRLHHFPICSSHAKLG